MGWSRSATKGWSSTRSSEASNRGHEGLKAWWQELFEAFSSYEGRIEDSLNLGDLVLVLAQVSARGKTSEMSDTRQVLQVFTLRKDKVKRLAAYFDSANALEDAARQLR